MIDEPLVVVHDVGDKLGGGPWRDAFVAGGWQGPVIAPDLPGHAGAPPPEGGNHESADASFVLVDVLAGLGQPAVVVGIGVNGWAATLAGLAGKAAAVVLVDGSGAPWRSPTDAVGAQRQWLRAIAEDPAAVAAPPAGATLDPRLVHGMPSHGSLRLAVKAAARLEVPQLLLESPRSAASPADAASLGRVIAITDRWPGTVASAVIAALEHLRVQVAEAAAKTAT